MKKSINNLESEMAKNLNIKATTTVNKIELGLNCLNKAAELLDNMNAITASEIITKVIEKVASKR